MKTPEEILETNFYKPSLRDWYNPVIHSMKEYASQFFTEEQVREIAIGFSIWTQKADGISEVHHVTQDLYDEYLKEQSKPQSE